MKLFNSLVNIILENTSRFEVLYNKLVKPKEGEREGVLPSDVFLELISIDPTTKPENVSLMSSSDFDKIKVGKYSNWILRNYLKPSDLGNNNNLATFRKLFLEDGEKLKKLLEKHSRFSHKLVDPDKKNIDNITSVSELFNLAVDTGVDESGNKTTEKLALYRPSKKKTAEVISSGDKQSPEERFSYPGSKILKVGSNYTLVEISDKGKLGQEAAQFFGGYYQFDKGETAWCTSPVNGGAFSSYISRGPLYVILANDDKGEVGELTKLPTERYQFHFPDFQFMNRGDEPINGWRTVNDVANLLSKDGMFGDFYDVFYSKMVNGFISNINDYKALKLTYTEGGSGSNTEEMLMLLYSELYGLDNLFDKLPNDIESIKLTNIQITDNFKKFSDSLQNLYLMSSPGQIPDIFEDFKNLKAFNFKTNPNSPKVLKSIVNLPNLELIIPQSNLDYSFLEDYGYQQTKSGNYIK